MMSRNCSFEDDRRAAASVKLHVLYYRTRTKNRVRFTERVPAGRARVIIMLKPTKMEKYGYFAFQIANNKGADQTARMRRLVCAFVVRKQQSQGFSYRGPYEVEAQPSWPAPGCASGPYK